MPNELMLNKGFLIKTILCYKTPNRLQFKVIFVYFLEVLQMIDIFDCMLTFIYVTTAVNSINSSPPSSLETTQEQIDSNISHFFWKRKKGVHLKRNIGFEVDMIILTFNRYFTYTTNASSKITILHFSSIMIQILSCFIEQWGFLRVTYLLWHGTSVYNGQLRRLVTLTPNAEHLAMDLTLPVLTT